MANSPGNADTLVERAFNARFQVDWEDYAERLLNAVFPVSPSATKVNNDIDDKTLIHKKPSVMKNFKIPVLQKAGNTYVLHSFRDMDPKKGNLLYLSSPEKPMGPARMALLAFESVCINTFCGATAVSRVLTNADIAPHYLFIFLNGIITQISKPLLIAIVDYFARQFRAFDNLEDFSQFIKGHLDAQLMENILAKAEDSQRQDRLALEDLEAKAKEARASEKKLPQTDNQLGDLSALIGTGEVTINWFTKKQPVSEPGRKLTLSEKMEGKVSSTQKGNVWTGVKIPAKLKAVFPYGYNIIVTSAKHLGLAVAETATEVEPKALDCFVAGEAARKDAIQRTDGKYLPSVYHVSRHLEQYTKLVSTDLMKNDKSMDFVYFQLVTFVSAYYQCVDKVGIDSQADWYRQRKTTFKNLMKEHWATLVGSNAAAEIMATTETIYLTVMKSILENEAQKSYIVKLVTLLTPKVVTQGLTLYSRMLPTKRITVEKKIPQKNQSGKITGYVTEKTPFTVKVHPKIDLNGPLTSFEKLVYKNVNNAFNNIEKSFVKDFQPGGSPKDWAASIQSEITRENNDLAEFNAEIAKRKDTIRAMVRAQKGNREKATTSEWNDAEIDLFDDSGESFESKAIALLNELFDVQRDKEEWKSVTEQQLCADYLRKRKP